MQSQKNSHSLLVRAIVVYSPKPRGEFAFLSQGFPQDFPMVFDL